MRIEPKFKQQLEDAVKEGKAENMSELIRQAVERFLKETECV